MTTSNLTSDSFVRVPKRTSALKIALCYAAAGAVWITCSDWVLHHLVSAAFHEVLSLLKGWLYVAFTALLLGWALDRYFAVIRRSALKLQESEERWKRALEGAAQGVWDWNPQTNEVHYSPDWKAILGHEPHEIGNTLLEWESRVHPDDLPRVMEEVRRHLEGETPAYTSEHRLRCKGGSYRWILERGKVTSRAPDGRALRMVGTLSDVHRRKQAEERNRLQHDLMLALAAANRLEDGLRFCLEAAIKADGLTCGGLYLSDAKDGTLSLRIHSGLSPEFANAVAQFEAGSPQGRLAAAGSPVYADFEELRLNQSAAELREGLHSIAILPLLNQGQLVGCLNVASHTHDEVPASSRLALETIAASAGEAIARLHAQEALRLSEAKFRAIASSTPDHIIVQDCELRYVMVINPQLGLTEADMIGKTDRDFLAPAEADKLIAAKRTVLESGKSLRFETPLTNRSGGTEYLEGTFIPRLDLAGRVDGLTGYFRNVTERKRAATALQENERQLTTLMANLPGMAYRCQNTPDWPMVFVSEGCAALTGYTAEALQNNQPAYGDVIVAEDRQSVWDGVQAGIQKRQPFELTYRIQTADGQLKWVWERGRGVFAAKRELLFLEGFITDITERKLAEVNTQRLAAIVESSDDAIVSKTLEGTILTWNRAAEQLYGYCAAEAIGQSMMLEVPQELGYELKDLLCRVGAGQHIQHFETMRQHKDGHRMQVSLTLSPIVDATGRVNGASAIVRDITKRKEAEAALVRAHQQRERALRFNEALLSAIPTPLFYKDRDGRYLGCNQSFSEMMGVTPEEISGKTVHELWPEENAQLYHLKDQELMANPGRQSFEFKVHDKLRDQREVIFVKDVFRDEQGQVAGIVGAFLDITERKQSEAALRESEARFRTVFEQAAVGVAEIDTATGRFLRVNQRYCDIVGYTREEMLRLDFQTLTHPDDLAADLVQMDRLKADTVREFALEKRYCRKDGAVVWVALTVAPLWSPGTAPTRHVAVVQDVTDRKRAQEALQQANETLEQRVAERTAALHQSEQRMDLAFRAAQDGIWDWNMETDEVFYSSRYKAMLGYEESEIEPHVSAWKRLLHPDDLSRAVEVVAGVLRGEREYVMEFRMRHKNGHYVDVLSRGFPIRRSPEGPIVRIVGTHFDLTERKRVEAELRRHREDLEEMVRERTQELEAEITERKQAEQALRVSEAKYRRLHETMMDAFVEVDMAGQILNCNRAYQTMLGYTEEELRQLTYQQMTPEKWHSFESRLVAGEIILKGFSGVYEKEYRRKDGSVFPVELSAFLLRNEAGEPAGIWAIVRDITERKRQAEQIVRARDFYLSLLDNAPALVWRAGTDGKCDWFNQTWLKFTGRSVEQERGDGWTEGVHPGDLDRCVQHYLGCFRRRVSFEMEYRLRHHSGEHRWIVDFGVPIRDWDGGFAGFIGYCYDVTERKQAETRTARERMRTQFLLELHQRAPQMPDKELFDHVLERAVQLTGSAIGFFHQVSEDQRTIILTTWNQEALKGCTASYNTHYPLNEAGNWVDCVRQQRPVVYNDYAHSPHQRGLPAGHTPVKRFMSIPVIREGKVRIIFGVGNKVEDYTEEDVAQLQVVANELHKVMVQRVAQSELRRSEERFRQLVETTADLIWETDASGRYTYVSPKIKDLLGYVPEALLGHTPFEFMPSGEAERVNTSLQRWIVKRSPFTNLENIALHKDGHEIHLETSGTPVLGDGGELLGYRGMDRDITERKRLESQFRQAQKLEAVGQLAGGVAHDFNNILAAIMMHLGLLKMNPALDEETRQGLKDLDAEARRAATLTRQLLMFSRRSVLTIKPQDLNDVVANLLKMLTRLIGENVKLNFEGGSRLPSVEADAGMLEQVLMNLVVNARDAMPKCGRISISTALAELGAADIALNPERRAGRFVCLAVSDTGIGMDEATLKRIFEPFFTTKDAGQGTGLGLATVYGIVAQHKGWVEVESQVGAGTTFRIYLPAIPKPALPTAQTAPPEPLRGGRETILLVEDDARVRQTVAQTLHALGYQVHEAANGRQAMALWQKHGPQVDMLFTDMVMPEGITGLELAERLQCLKPGLPVIISSGYSAEIAQAGVPDKAGVIYLPKPYEARTLADTVRNCLKKA